MNSGGETCGALLSDIDHFEFFENESLVAKMKAPLGAKEGSPGRKPWES